jgi:UDP-glucose 6-dehydrogenase
MDKILIIGNGMVGGHTGKVLEFIGHKVYYFDKDPNRCTPIAYYLNDVMLDQFDEVFVCVPTPTPNEEQDLTILWDTIDNIATQKYKGIVVLRSTIVPGTCKAIAKKYPKLKLIHMPEFLTEKNALYDSLNPDKIVIGGDTQNRMNVWWLYSDFYNDDYENSPHLILCDLKTAEMVKYANNCFLAAKVALANEFFDACTEAKANYNVVREALYADKRTEERGFGGHCLVAGTKLLTLGEGIKNIEDIEIGDKVFDGKEFTKVTKTGQRRVRETIKLISRGRTLHGSFDHIHLVWNHDKKELEERNLCDVTTDNWVFVPEFPELANEIEIELDKPNNYVKNWSNKCYITSEVTRLLGLYLAEGCKGIYSRKHTIYWVFGEHEESLANETCSLLKMLNMNPYKHYQVSEGTYGTSRCWRVRCRSRWLYDLFDKLQLGNNALEKNTLLFGSTVSPELIGGWLEGDGSYFNGTVEGYSRSKNLIHSLDTMLLSLGINPVIMKKGEELRISIKKDVKKLCGLVKRFKFDPTRYKTDIEYESPTMKKVDGGWITRVTRVEELPSEEVFTIETKSHRYVANNILTHNCFPKDTQAFIHRFPQAKIMTAVVEYNNEIRGVEFRE